MLSKIRQNWKTTMIGVIGGSLMIAGVLWPTRLDVETQQIINTAVGDILTGIGAFISVITNVAAEDPKKNVK